MDSTIKHSAKYLIGIVVFLVMSALYFFMMADVMDADWLVFHPNAKVPNFVLPEGAVDADCHVVSPSPDFPFAPE